MKVAAKDERPVPVPVPTDSYTQTDLINRAVGRAARKSGRGSEGSALIYGAQANKTAASLVWSVKSAGISKEDNRGA